MRGCYLVVVLVLPLASAVQQDVSAHDCSPLQLTGLSVNEPGASAMGYYMETGWVNKRPTYKLGVPEYMVLPNNQQNQGSDVLWYSDTFDMWIVSAAVHKQPFVLGTKSRAPIASRITSKWANYYDGHFSTVSRIKSNCAGVSQPPSRSPSTAPTHIEYQSKGTSQSTKAKKAAMEQKAFAQIINIERIEDAETEEATAKNSGGAIQTPPPTPRQMAPHLESGEFIHPETPSWSWQTKGTNSKQQRVHLGSKQTVAISKSAAIAAAKAAVAIKRAGGSMVDITKAAGDAAGKVVLAHGGTAAEASTAASAALSAVGFSPSLNMNIHA